MTEKKQTYPSRRGKPESRRLGTDPETGDLVRFVFGEDGIAKVTSDSEQRVADAMTLTTVRATTSTKES